MEVLGNEKRKSKAKIYFSTMYYQKWKKIYPKNGKVFKIPVE